MKMARSAYFPTLSLSAGTSGFAREASDPDFLVAQAQSASLGQIAQCESPERPLQSGSPILFHPSDCSQFLFTEAQRQAIVDRNNAFPLISLANRRRHPSPSASPSSRGGGGRGIWKRPGSPKRTSSTRCGIPNWP